MGKRISDNEMLFALDQLKEEKAEEWEKQFGSDLSPFCGCQRSEIQQRVAEMYNKEYSDGGMRNRLHKLVDKELLSRFRVGMRTVYYY